MAEWGAKISYDSGMPLEATELDQFRKLLLGRQAELRDLRAMSDSESATVMLDQQSVGRLSRMDALQRQAMGAEQARRRDLELQRLTQALARIEDGSFGECTECGEDIAPGRLRVDPAASLCIRCAQAQG